MRDGIESSGISSSRRGFQTLVLALFLLLANPLALRPGPSAALACYSGGQVSPGDTASWGDGPDEYEDDDTWQDGSTIGWLRQERNFHDANDEDWVRYEVNWLGPITIYTDDLGGNCDTVLELYGPAPGDTSGPGPLLMQDDDGMIEGYRRASLIRMELEAGVYFIRVRQYDGSQFGEDTHYTLSASQDTLCYGSLEGYVRVQANGRPVVGALVRLEVYPGEFLTVQSDADGYYLFANTVPGSSGRPIQATKTGYETYAGTSPAVYDGVPFASRHNIVLTPQAGTGTIAGHALDGGTYLPGVSMIISGMALETNAAGFYWARVSEGSAHSVMAHKSGYEDFLVSNVAVVAGQETTLNIRLIPVDSDGDGLSDDQENNVYFTDPGDPDTDDDGISDGDEVNLFNTRPESWDSDGDYLSDGFEVLHGASLNPLNPADAGNDPDGDTNPIVHELYNDSDPWSADPVPQAGYEVGCYYWGKSDGGIAVQPLDIVAMQKAYVGVSVDYSDILPSQYDPMDLDRDMFPGPGDIVLAQGMYAGLSRPGGYASSPIALTVEDAPASPVAVGDTTHITLSVHAAGPGAEEFSPGFGVVFWVASGNAVLLGGEGTAPSEAAGNRYDVSMKGAEGAPANVVVLVTGPGLISINAKVPGCGVEPLGRWCAEVGLAAPVVVNP